MSYPPLQSPKPPIVSHLFLQFRLGGELKIMWHLCYRFLWPSAALPPPRPPHLGQSSNRLWLSGSFSQCASADSARPSKHACERSAVGPSKVPGQHRSSSFLILSLSIVTAEISVIKPTQIPLLFFFLLQIPITAVCVRIYSSTLPFVCFYILIF